MAHTFISRLQAMLAHHARARACVCALLMACVSSASLAQTALSEAQLKTALVLNFARYVDWPEASFSNGVDPLVVCLIGRDTLGGALSSLEGKQIRNRPIKVKTGVSGEEIRSCHVAFISDSEERRIVPLLRGLADKPILTVSDIGGFVEAGGAIGIVQGETRLQFDVNRRALEQSQLKASSNLLKLARNLSEPQGKN
jgi:YfiR/HmsC-like